MLMRLFRKNKLDEQLDLFYSFKRERSLLVFALICLVASALMGCVAAYKSTETGTEYGIELFRKEKPLDVQPPPDTIEP